MYFFKPKRNENTELKLELMLRRTIPVTLPQLSQPLVPFCTSTCITIIINIFMIVIQIEMFESVKYQLACAQRVFFD